MNLGIYTGNHYFYFSYIMSRLKLETMVASRGEKMEANTISKNGQGPNNQMNWVKSINTVILGLVFGMITNCNNYGELKIFNGTQLFYTSSVTLSDVNKLGEYLVDSEFADGEKKSVQLNKTGNTYEFRMVVKKGTELNQEYQNLGKIAAAQISEICFNGANVEMHFCDENFKTLIVLPMAMLSD